MKSAAGPDPMPQSAPPPIACALDKASLQRRKGLLRNVIGKATARVELADGYEFSFDSSAVSLGELTQVIELEHSCCAFLRFVLIVEPASGPLRLQVGGPEGTKDFLTSALPAC
jgi:hypothetical protein